MHLDNEYAFFDAVDMNNKSYYVRNCTFRDITFAIPTCTKNRARSVFRRVILSFK